MPKQGTIFPADDFDPEEDCKILKKAMAGLGTDEKLMIDILAYRSAAQRVEINETYVSMYGADLADKFKSELSGNFRNAMFALLCAPSTFDAAMLREAMDGVGTDERCLIEIICTRKNEEIDLIKLAYAATFDRDLEEDVKSDTSGHFKKVLVSCLQGNRSDSDDVDTELAYEEAQELYDAGEGCWGTEESVFNAILTRRSAKQLRKTFKKYSELSGRDIVTAIDNETSGDLKDAYITIVLCAINRPLFFAVSLEDAMKGLGTAEDVLTRIIVSRSEIDLENIKEQFEATTGKSLASWIRDDTSGDYKRLLLALIRAEEDDE